MQHTDSIEAGYWWAEQVAHRIGLDRRFGQGRNGFIHGLKKVLSAAALSALASRIGWTSGTGESRSEGERRKRRPSRLHLFKERRWSGLRDAHAVDCNEGHSISRQTPK